jgi:hypothetical protein
MSRCEVKPLKDIDANFPTIDRIERVRGDVPSIGLPIPRLIRHAGVDHLRSIAGRLSKTFHREADLLKGKKSGQG